MKLKKPCNKCLVRAACRDRSTCKEYYKYKVSWMNITPILYALSMLLMCIIVLFIPILLLKLDIVESTKTNGVIMGISSGVVISALVIIIEYVFRKKEREI